MIACVDVAYRENEGVAACVLFHTWTDDHAGAEKLERIHPIAAYQPGQFYRRELPCLLAVLGRVTEPLETVVVDGYVWLDEDHTAGLGAHLFQALGGLIPVVGVAKTRYASAAAEAVWRGGSRRPLYVTTAGMDAAVAARHVQNMHGPFRIPTLLRRVDQLCRGR